ncbi:MAG: hypothetical protein M3137_15825 [Actinomycetota bacterium]|nr:hypothetical protein [Actinomycetota bacterium]
MGMMQRLDDLDTRVIGRGDPDWNSPTPKPWTPDKGRLVPMGASLVPFAWILTPAGVIALVLMFAFPGDNSYLWVLLRSVWFPLVMFMIGLRATGRFLHSAAPLPPDPPIDRTRPAAPWALAIVIAVVYLTLVLLGAAIKGDAAANPLFASYLLGGGVYSVTAKRQIAKWENTHGVEVIRARWRGGSRGFYVRPR